MASFIGDRIFDEGLNSFNAECDLLTLVTTVPTNYTEARTTYQIATKSAPTISTATDKSGGGREVTVSAITSGGIVNANGTASHWTLLDTANSRLLAYGELDSLLILTTAYSFTLTEFTIGIPDPA